MAEHAKPDKCDWDIKKQGEYLEPCLEMYKVELTKQAEKSFSFLMRSNPKMGKRVAKVIDSLAENPEKGTALKGELAGFLKYRVGSYRLIYCIKRDKLVVTVIDIGHRREIYR